MTIEDALLDTDRKNYYEGNLNAILAAVNEEGVNVKAYFAWSAFSTISDCTFINVSI